MTSFRRCCRQRPRAASHGLDGSQAELLLGCLVLSRSARVPTAQPLILIEIVLYFHGFLLH